MSPIQVHNYFHCRWLSGYSFISDAPNQAILKIEHVMSTRIAQTHQMTFDYSYDRTSAMAIGIIAYAGQSDSLGRHVDYTHAVALTGVADGDQTKAILGHAFHDVYGDNPEKLLSELIKRLSRIDKEEGRPLLRDFTIPPEAFAGVLPAGPTSDKISIQQANESSRMADSLVGVESDEILQEQAEGGRSRRSKHSKGPNALSGLKNSYDYFLPALCLLSVILGIAIGLSLPRGTSELEALRADLREMSRSIQQIVDAQKGMDVTTREPADLTSTPIIPEEREAYATTRSVRLRAHPGGVILKELPPGKTLEFLEDTEIEGGKWGRFATETGWVKMDYVIKMNDK